MSRRARLAGAALLATASVALLVDSLRGALHPEPSASATSLLRNRLALPPTEAERAIPLAPMRELDGLQRDQILRLRSDALERHRHLLEGGYYRPSEAIFGQIVDGRPWWGIHGVYLWGPGDRSDDGPAEESRFILNPLLLVGLAGPSVWIARCQVLYDFHPLPTRLGFYEGGRPIARVRYELGRTFTTLAAMHGPLPQHRVLELVAYNARDLGLPYLAIDRARTRNVLAPPSGIVEIRQFIHLGGSCGKPGGCNNMSPYQPELSIRVPRLPARLHLRLYREPAPASADAPADLEQILELE